MRVTIAAAGTRTGAATIQSLIETAPAGTEIFACYRNLAKVPEAFKAHPGFHAVQADVNDRASLDFAGSHAVLAMTPPVFENSDEQARAVCTNIKDAVEKSGTVKRLILLSSKGAEFESGVVSRNIRRLVICPAQLTYNQGEIHTNHVAEQTLKDTQVDELLFVRPCYFMDNWTEMTETLQGDEPFFMSPITPVDFKFPMIANKDIGTCLATGLTSSYTPPQKPYIFELHGPEDYSPSDVQAAFAAALDRPVKIQAIEKADLAGFFGEFLPPNAVPGYVEMTESILPDGLFAKSASAEIKPDIVRGKTSLNEAMKHALAGKV